MSCNELKSEQIMQRIGMKYSRFFSFHITYTKLWILVAISDAFHSKPSVAMSSKGIKIMWMPTRFVSPLFFFSIVTTTHAKICLHFSGKCFAMPKMTKQSIGCQNFMNQHCALKLISIDKQSVRNFRDKLKVSLSPSKSVWMNHWNQCKLVWYTYNVNFRSIVISAGSRFRSLNIA